jgi:hypothetical protein
MSKIHHVSLKFFWPFNFFYIYLQIGPERRQRGKEEESKNIPLPDKRRHQGLAKGIVYYFLISGICGFLGILFLLSLYILKSEVGIDLLSQSHLVKDYFSFLGLCPGPHSLQP